MFLLFFEFIFTFFTLNSDCDPDPFIGIHNCRTEDIGTCTKMSVSNALFLRKVKDWED